MDFCPVMMANHQKALYSMYNKIITQASQFQVFFITYAVKNKKTGDSSARSSSLSYIGIAYCLNI